MTGCLICAQRGRQTTLDHGLVCPACSVRLADALDDIARLAASATVEPRTGRGSGRTVPGSRPPIDVDGVDPALALARLAPPPAEPVPVLVVVEGWVRLVREERGMGPYGPWSAATAPRLDAAGRTAPPRCDDTTATLVACTGFLRVHHEWVVCQDWVDAYAAELWACRRALARWDDDREPAATAVACPTVTVDGPCGYRLRLDADRIVCPRCGRDRDAAQLAREALTDDVPDVWVDVDSAAAGTGIPARTIQRWGADGHVRRQQGRYSLLDVRTKAATREGPRSLTG